MDSKEQTFETTPPAVLVRDRAEARRAVAAGRRLVRPLLLVTEPGAQGWLGPAYLLEMVRQAGAARALIDCGPDAGTAMLALRVGWKELHLTGSPANVVRLAEMTVAVGGRFHAALPEAFDLAAAGPVDEPLERWLGATGSN